MSRVSFFSSPLLLGFDQFERNYDRVQKAQSDGYPPYNVEQIGEVGNRITLAVAGFSTDELSVNIEDGQLVVRGRQEDDDSKVYLHRGIAARQFQRSFVLADGITVEDASLDSGLLHIELKRPLPETKVQTIPIKTPAKAKNSEANVTTIDVDKAS